MPVVGTPRKFHHKYKFVVEVDGFASSHFQKCSELSGEVAVVEYSEGGALIANKSPGRITFSELTLERGATSDLDMFRWYKDVANAAANAGKVDPSFRKNLDIVQQERDGTTLRRWRLTGAWPSKFVAGDWDNEADETVIESITLQYDYFDIVS